MNLFFYETTRMLPTLISLESWQPKFEIISFDVRRVKIEYKDLVPLPVLSSQNRDIFV